MDVKGRGNADQQDNDGRWRQAEVKRLMTDLERQDQHAEQDKKGPCQQGDSRVAVGQPAQPREVLRGDVLSNLRSPWTCFLPDFVTV